MQPGVGGAVRGVEVHGCGGRVRGGWWEDSLGAAVEVLGLFVAGPGSSMRMIARVSTLTTSRRQRNIPVRLCGGTGPLEGEPGSSGGLGLLFTFSSSAAPPLPPLALPPPLLSLTRS